MREFSLLHSRYRQLPFILAVLLVGGVLVALNRNGTDDERTCSGAALIESTAESTVESADDECVSADDGPTTPAAPSATPPDDEPVTTSTIDPDWSTAVVDGADVPFASLQPSPETMTESGRDLVAELEQQRDDPPTTSVTSAPSTTAPADESGGVLDVGLGR